MTRRDWMKSVAAAGLIPGPTDDFAGRIYKRANELRVARGASELVWLEPVAACARQQSERKAALRFPGHNDPERGDIAARLTAAGVGWSACGENLFMERGYDDPVNFAIVSWWYSPGHQENMLNPDYTQTGVGVTQAADGAYFATQIFLKPPAPPLITGPQSQPRNLQRPRRGRSGG